MSEQKKVQRFNTINTSSMVISPTGRYVEYSAYDAVMKELDELKEQNKDLKQDLTCNSYLLAEGLGKAGVDISCCYDFDDMIDKIPKDQSIEVEQKDAELLAAKEEISSKDAIAYKQAVVIQRQHEENVRLREALTEIYDKCVSDAEFTRKAISIISNEALNGGEVK